MKIDIDRHILQEIINNGRRMETERKKMMNASNKFFDLHERNMALYLHLVGEIGEVDTKRDSKK